MTHTILNGNISNPTSQNQNSSTKDYSIEGLTYTITVNYDSKTGTYTATEVKLKLNRKALHHTKR